MDLTCPKCQASMRSYERSGITIDQCSECRGIFLDRGELEKLIDAESSWQADASRGQPAAPQPAYGGSQHSGQKPKKKRSFLEDLFE